jgi:predicted glycosyltransferase
MAFGGLPMPLDTGSWKLPEGWHAIVFAQGARDGPATTAGAALDWPFADLLASVDLLVAKPGYGTFAEAGFVSRDTLVVPRDDWPESPYLVDWLARHARVATLALADLRAGRIAEAVAALEARPRRAAASGDGALAIAETIAARLGAPP